MAASTQPRVKKKRINWSKGEHAVKMTKALTKYLCHLFIDPEEDHNR